MTLPKPEVGLVVHYAYLWAKRTRRWGRGRRQNRPCAVVAAKRSVDGKIWPGVDLQPR